MDIVTIECPNCGGRIDRAGDGYFANCPYCGTEVCFDEIKEEIQSGELNKLRKWLKWRNIAFAAFWTLSFFAFFFVGLSTSLDPGNDALVGIGAVMFIMLFMLFFAGPAVLSTCYPDYDLINGHVSYSDRLVMWGKLAAISFGISLLAAFAAYVVLSFMGRA